MSDNLSSILGVHVCSGAFEGGSDIDLFLPKKRTPRASVIFGHNGAGKSTIAREIEAIANAESDGYFYSGSEKTPLKNIAGASIRVFNESYVENRTRIDEDGLEAFAMLGEQVELTDDLEKVEKRIQELNRTMLKTKEEVDGLENGEESAQHYFKEAKKRRQGRRVGGKIRAFFRKEMQFDRITLGKDLQIKATVKRGPKKVAGRV